MILRHTIRFCVALFMLMQLSTAAQVTPPTWGCSIRYDHDAAGNRTSRYRYCWGDSNKSLGQDTTSTSNPVMADMSLGVFPNPASDELTITVSNSIDHANYTVHNIHGGVMQEGLFQGERITVSISGLAPGAYFVRLMRGDEMLVRQFIVQ